MVLLNLVGRLTDILKNMAQRLTEIDWRPEVTINIGPASIRLYPSNGAEKVQSEWMALDAWVAVRGTLRSKPGEAPVNFNEKEKGAARSLFMINQIRLCGQISKLIMILYQFTVIGTTS